MSKQQNQTWRTGESWGFEVEMLKADGSPLVPTEVRFFMGTEHGAAISWTSSTNASRVWFEGDIATIVIPLNARAGIINDVYDYVVQAVFEGEPVDQLNGTITVDRSGFPESA